MKNQKLYFKLSLFLIILYVIFIYFASFIHRNYIDETNKFLRVPNNLKIISLGSSHGLYGIKFPNDIGAYKLDLVSQNLYYDSKILEKYSLNLEKKAKVIIPISVFSFYGDKDCKNNNERYYNFLDYKDIYKGDVKKEFLVKNFYIFSNGRALFSTLKFMVKSIIKREVKPNEKQWPTRVLTLEEKIKEAETTTKRHLGKDIIYLEYIKNILETCKDNNLIPILITTPQSYLYNERITDEKYEERIYSHIENLKKEYNFNYLDYSHDKRFEKNLELFYDDDHLNEKGAEYFTNILLKDIENTEK